MAVRLMTNRRGMFFTLVAILIITILFVSFSPQYASRINYELPVTESRVEAGNELVETIKYSYVPQALSASSYHALKSLSHHLKTRTVSPGQGFADLDELNETFESIMLHGTLIPGGTSIYSGMERVHFMNLLDQIEASSIEHLQIETKFMRENFNVALYQNADTGAFQVGVNLTINFSVDAGLARWEDLENISVAFEFEDIEDPLYAINLNSAPDSNPTNFVNKFNETNRISYDVSNTFLEVTYRTYTYAGKRIVDGSDDAKYHAPSFLGRFVQGHNVNAAQTLNPKTLRPIEYDKGGIYSDCCGIESLINQPEMYNTVPLQLGARSHVDWCYFRNYPSGPPDFCWVPTVGVQGLRSVGCITTGTDPLDGGNLFGNFPEFRLDERHGETYNVTDFFYEPGTVVPEFRTNAHVGIRECSAYIP